MTNNDVNVVKAYQSKGRDHIRYINQLAHNLWENRGYDEQYRFTCIKEALAKHVKYLRTAEIINKEAAENLENKKADSVKPREIFWRNPRTNVWERLIIK